MNSKRLILLGIILLCSVATISYAGQAVKKTTKPTKAQVASKSLPITMATSADAKITLPDAPNPVGQTVTVLQAGRHKKPFNATVKSYTTNEVVFTTDEGDKNIKLKDITKLMPTEPETAVATTNEH